MNEKRYQVFLSSTFRDLKDERQAVLDAILKLRHIPAGMEIFPAADSTPWEMIRSIINDSDYYVLIIGGRYGSSEADGISYTEREYALAVELQKPVLAFLHAAPETLPYDKNEKEKKTRRKLANFRKAVQKHHCKYWQDISTLQTQVIISLTWAIQTHPTTGWVRASGFNDTELLRRLADLQQRFDQLKQETLSLRERLGTPIDASIYAQGEEQVTISFHFNAEVPREEDSKTDKVLISWNEIFFGIGMDLVVAAREYDLGKSLSPVIFGAFYDSAEFAERKRTFNDGKYYREKCIPTVQCIQTIIKQFAALGLIEPHLVSRTMTDESKKTYSTLEDAWRLTHRGREKYFSKVAIRSHEELRTQLVTSLDGEEKNFAGNA